MTSKALLSGFLRKGKQVLQGVLKNKTQNVGVKVARVPKQPEPVQPVVHYRSQLTQNKLYNVWQKILPQIYFRSLASKLGRQAAWQCGRNVPLFAFVGIVMAQHAEKEEDEIVEKIHEFVKAADVTTSPLLKKIQELSLDQFEFGQLIGQGCNAAVYEAHLKNDAVLENPLEDVTSESVYKEDAVNSNTGTTNVLKESEYLSNMENSSLAVDADDDYLNDTDSDITILSLSDDDMEESEKAPLEFQTATEEDFVYYSDAESDISFLSFLDDESDVEQSEMAPREFEVSVEPTSNTELVSVTNQSDKEDDNNVDLLQSQQHNLSLSMSCTEILASFKGNAEAVTEQNDTTEVKLEDSLEYTSLDSSNSTETTGRFNLAVKMMFNYGAESNADAIMREMERETVPARLAQTHGQMETWQNGHKVRLKRLPPHPNIVEMWGVFVDPMPHLPDSLLNYPAALPARINPQGIGRNMTMFLVMKKYQSTLGEYLSTFNPSFGERLNLLAQLFEAVAHMRRHGIAHRDLKLDNIFLDTFVEGVPQLVVGDFGCCLADEKYGLQIPYPTEHMDRGGNTALMAPEISTAEPGMFSYLDFRKSDLWATGALAYEILGAGNPFYTHQDEGRLDSRTYSEEELPPLPEDVPKVVKELVFSVLNRDPHKRPTARLAADVIQVLLWAPSNWLLPSNEVSRSEVNWWLISMATEVLLGAKSTYRQMKRCFLENFNMNNLNHVFHFLGCNMT